MGKDTGSRAAPTLGVAAVSLLVGVLLGVALAADLAAAPPPLAGVDLADTAVATLLDTQARSVGEEDIEGLRATFTRDARLVDLARGRSLRGADGIALFYGQLPDTDVRITSDVVDFGGLYAASYAGPDAGSDDGPGGVVLFSVRDGKVADLVLLPFDR